MSQDENEEDIDFDMSMGGEDCDESRNGFISWWSWYWYWHEKIISRTALAGRGALLH